MKSFRELLSEESQVILEDEELSGYYLYFIIFRSPQNASKWNLYVGIKHSRNSPAPLFFGSLRFSGKGSYFESGYGGGQSFFEDQLFRLKPNENKPQVSESRSYMSSAELVSSESITTAYKLGIEQQKLKYHPLMCSTKVLSNITKEGENKFFTKIKNIVVNFVRKIQKKKEQDETIYLPVEVGDREKQIQFATSSDYGYRIYVCDDMREYSKILDEIIADSKSIDFTKQSNVEKVRSKQNDTPENNAEREEKYNTQALEITDRFWRLLNTAFSNFPNYQSYFDFIKKQHNIKTATREICAKKLQIIAAEGENQREDETKKDKTEKDEKGQADNSSVTGSFKNKPEIFKACYLPDKFMTKESIKKALDACKKKLGIKGSNENEESDNSRVLADGLDELDNSKRFNVETAKLKRLGKNSNGFTNAVLSFTSINSFKDNRGGRTSGLRDQHENLGKITATLMYNSKTNLLKKARQGDSKAISELKRIFEKIEIPIALRKHPQKPLNSLGIILADENNNDFIVCKKGNVNLVLKNAKDSPTNNEIFTMYDLVLLLGYSQITPDEIKAMQEARLKKGNRTTIRKNTESIAELSSRVGIGPSLKEDVQLQEDLRLRKSSSSDGGILPIFMRNKVGSELKKSKLSVPDYTNIDRQIANEPESVKRKADELTKKADEKIAKEKAVKKQKENAAKPLQTKRTNQLALNFIKNLFANKASEYNELFYEDERGTTKSINFKELQGILLKPKEKELAEEFNIQDMNLKGFYHFLSEDNE